MRENRLDGDISLSRPLFDMVFRIRAAKTEGEWKEISEAMEREWMLHWLRYLEEKGIITPRKKAVIDKSRIRAEIIRNAGSPKYITAVISRYQSSGRVEDLYPLLVLITEHSDSIRDTEEMMLSETFFYRNLEYCDYLLSTRFIVGVSSDEIREMFIKALAVLGLPEDNICNPNGESDKNTPLDEVLLQR